MTSNDPRKSNKTTKPEVDLDESISAQLPRRESSSSKTLGRWSQQQDQMQPSKQKVSILDQWWKLYKTIAFPLGLIIIALLIVRITSGLVRINSGGDLLSNIILPSVLIGFFVREVILRLAGDITTNAPPPAPPTKKKM
jgi:hypothetical protein